MTTANARRDISLTLLCLVAGLVIAAIPWTINHRFYFHDDIQHWYMPLFYHIGHVLRQGQVPLLSLANFTTSNLLGEYQTGLFSPFLLALFYILPSFDNVETAGLFFVAANMAVLGGGLYVLARSYRIAPHLAVFFAVAVLCNNMLIYWYAGSWWSLLYGSSWFVWAWASLNRADRSPLWTGLAVVFCYLTIVGGFPNVTLLLGGISLAIAVQKRAETGEWGPSVLTLLAMGAAGLLSMIPLLALVSMQAVSIRSTATLNTGFLVPDLRDVLAFSSPFHRAPIGIFGGYRPISTPIYYCSWLAAPLFALIDWRRSVMRQAAVIAVLVVAGVLLIATQGPEQIHTLRWPFRWLPYFHLALLLAILVVLQRSGMAVLTRSRRWAVAGIIVLQLVLSFQANPPDILLHLAGTAVVVVGVLLFIGSRHRPVLQSLSAVAVTMAVLVGTHLVYPSNRDLPDRGISVDPGVSYGAQVPRSYELYLGGFGNEGDPARLSEYATGLVPLSQGRAMINGYTPLGHRALAEFTCMDIFGLMCPDAGPRLLSVDPDLGVPLVDLFRVDRVTVLKGPHLDLAGPLLEGTWTLGSEGTYTRTYTRSLPNAGLPGTVSWTSPGMSVASAGEPGFMQEPVQVTAGEGGGTVIFARLYWPGYHAFLNGRELPLDAYRGVFVRVQVPPNSQGALSLQFIPPHRTIGITAMLAGLLLTILLMVLHRRLIGHHPRGRPEGGSRVRSRAGTKRWSRLLNGCFRVRTF